MKVMDGRRGEADPAMDVDLLAGRNLKRGA
jgi:hypothetical protein